MKRLMLSIGLILALVGIAAGHVWFLTTQTEKITEQLGQAHNQVEQGNWDEAYRLTQEAWEVWEGQLLYLHITLHHEDIDQVSTAFRETLAILKQKEQPGEYVAANARILYQLHLVTEAELPSLKNIL